MAAETRTPVLRFENVTVSFDGEVALRDISFAAYESDSRIILGAAGSGKTVLLKTAMGLTPPESGKVFVFGQDISTMREKQLFDIRSKIGMLFQESALFDSLNIQENVAYPLVNQPSIKCPPGEVLPRVKQTLEFVELGGTLAKFPSELSGGMRRRAAIARAVVTEPPLQMYDSPTAGLDPSGAHPAVIKERDVSQATTMLVTQRFQDGNLMANFRYNSEQGALEPARTGDKQKSRTTFMVLKEGRLVFEDDQDAIESSNDPYIKKFVKQRV
jgi:phospholipid/cholesterol/gamma-HCH transport system ATP-binding protein